MASTSASSNTAAENASATVGRAPSSTRSMAVWPMPWKMKVPSPPGPNQRRDGHQSDVLHQHDANSGDDHRQGKRQFDGR